MNPLLLLGTLLGVLALAAIAWIMGLGRREPLTREEVAERLAHEYGPLALRTVLLSQEGKSALAFAHDGRVFGVKAHGADLASRELRRPLVATEKQDTLVIDTRDRWFGPLRLRLGRAQLPSVRAML
jgi:hypothetical protein